MRAVGPCSPKRVMMMAPQSSQTAKWIDMQSAELCPQPRVMCIELCDELRASTLVEDAKTHASARQHDAVGVLTEATKRSAIYGFRDMTEGPEQRVRGSEYVEAEAMVFTGEVTHGESPNLADGGRIAKKFVP